MPQAHTTYHQQELQTKPLPKMVAYRMKFRLIKKSSKRCQGCSREYHEHVHTLTEGDQLQLDHKVPWRRGGNDSPGNFQILCHPCREGKRNERGTAGPIRHMTDIEWRAAGMPQIPPPRHLPAPRHRPFQRKQSAHRRAR